jgi:hypothetical protein
VIDRERYLVVLEQVSDAAEWDAIKAYLPDNKNGSRIIMSTQQLGIALYCTGSRTLSRSSDSSLMAVHLFTPFTER